MIKIGLTGSIASGKTISSKIVSFKRGPLFSADKVVKKLYTKDSFKKNLSRIFELKANSSIKKNVKNFLLANSNNLKKLEKLIHPLVREEMIAFFKKNQKKKYLFCEIPLLIESKLKKYFDVVIFIKSKRSLRLKRYKSKGGSNQFFRLLDHHQLKDSTKMKYCDHVVVNNKSLNILKKNLSYIMRLYE